MSQQTVWHPHCTSTTPAHRRHRSSRLFLAAMLLALPLNVCTGQLASAPIQTTQEVIAEATALTTEQVTGLETDVNTGPDIELPMPPTENNAIMVLANWERNHHASVGVTLVSRNRSDGALKWVMTITPPGASLNALEMTGVPQQNVLYLLQSCTSEETLASPNERHVSLILTPHREQSGERLVEQESHVAILDTTSGAVMHTEELSEVVPRQGLTSGSLVVKTTTDYFPGGTGKGQVHVFGLGDPPAPSSPFAIDQWFAGAGADPLLLSLQLPCPSSNSDVSTVTQVDTSGKVHATTKGVEIVHPGSWVAQVNDPAAVSTSINHITTGKKKKPAFFDAALQELIQQVIDASTGSGADVTGTIVQDWGAPTRSELMANRMGTGASGETTSTPVFQLSAAGDDHPHIESLERPISKQRPGRQHDD